jgi:hypothetical protein
MKFKEKDILKIYWKDARTYTDTYDYEKVRDGSELVELIDCISIGYIMKQTKEFIAISSCIFTDSLGPAAVRYIHVIPKSWITKIVKLK